MAHEIMELVRIVKMTVSTVIIPVFASVVG